MSDRAAERPLSAGADIQALVMATNARNAFDVLLTYYRESMAQAKSEQQGRADLARWMVVASTPLFVAVLGALYQASPAAVMFSKVLCGAGALLVFMTMWSADDRYELEKAHLSRSIKLEMALKKLMADFGIVPMLPQGLELVGTATDLRDFYEAPGFMPGRVNAAGVATSLFWLVVFFGIHWKY